ncbi:MAG: alpha/beta hydrolase [Pseudomonadales bacterium]
MSKFAIREAKVDFNGHTTAYLEAGPTNGPAMIFVHGWPERAISWRHQLPVFGGLGFRVIAPDQRGYGDSTVYRQLDDYALEKLTGDMIGLIDVLGIESAIWVGHDWGSPVVWSVASHYPARCRGVASLCVPYYHLERGLAHTISLVDRALYPEDEYPAGQWDYQLYYQEQFEAATRAFDANPRATIKALFRKGDPAGRGQPAGTARIRAAGGWFAGLDEAPDVPLDTDVLSEAELDVYASGLERNGFFGPDAFYMNHEANEAFAKQAVNGGRLAMPALFLAGRYDYVCETVESGAAEPMRAMCDLLDEQIVDSGHWMAQERPIEVNQALNQWLIKRQLMPMH